MAIRLLGNRHDVIAFGLAGLETVECRTRAELREAIDVAASEAHLALLIVAPAVAALGPDLVAGLRDSNRPPIAVVLPAPSPAAAPRIEPA
jgi:vacuolar-type H+-ATPase subunit F/Vma7